MRQYHDQLLKEHLEQGADSDADSDLHGLGLTITRSRPTRDPSTDWLYEIDLDRHIFHLNFWPMYRLDNMPPGSLLQGISSNMYDRHVCDKDVPVEYRFAPDALPARPPPVDNGMLEKYQSTVRQPESTVDTLLSRNGYAAPGMLKNLEVVVAERTAYFHLCMQEWVGLVIEEFAYLSDATAVSPLGRSLAFNLAALALVPMLTSAPHMFQDSKCIPKRAADGDHNEGEGSKGQEPQKPVPTGSQKQERVWWPRKHICVLLATHLTDEDTRKAAIAQMVEEIVKKDKDDTPEIMYGVVFSVFHCVLVRIDMSKDSNGKQVTHTNVLPFCPDMFVSGDLGPEQRTTPGLAALVRLGNIPAADDVDLFYAALCSLKAPDTDSTASDKEECSIPTARISQNTSQLEAAAPPAIPTGEPAEREPLPQELINHIASLIDDAYALASFARAARRTMAAALPRLRLPNIFLPKEGTGIVLQRHLPADKHTELTETAFSALYKGQRVVVTFTDGPPLPYRPRGKPRREELTWASWVVPLIVEPPPDMLAPRKLDYTVWRDIRPA